MALTVLNNPIDSFWHDQNQKLLANPFFISDRGDYYCDEWYFYERGGVTKIDFSVFDSLIFNFDTLATLQKNGAECSLTSKEYAKLFCMAVLTTKSSRAVLPAYQMAMHLFAFFNERHEIALSASLLDAFWTSFMARTVNQNGLFNRVSAPSHQGYIKPVPFSKLRNQLMALGVTG